MPNTNTSPALRTSAAISYPRAPTASARIEPAILAASLIAFFTLTLLITMRLSPDSIRGARFIRSLLARTLLFACSGTLVALAVATCRRLGGAYADWVRTGLGGAVAGMMIHLMLLTLAAYSFDAPLHRRVKEVEGQSGIVTFRLPHRDPISVLPEGDGWTRREPMASVPPLASSLLCSAEDERCTDRLVCVDVEAYLRASVVAIRRAASGRPGNWPGASDLSAQVAMMLLGLKPRGHGWDAFLIKMRKTVAGCRLDDLLSRDDQIRLYLTLAPFGTIHGHEVIGLAAAASVFYSRTPDELSPAQMAELMARLRNPQLYYPYSRAGEPPAAFQARLKRLRERTFAILAVARRVGRLSTTEYDQARSEFLSGLTPAASLDSAALLPAAAPLIRTALDRVPDAATRHLEVWSSADPALEQQLAAAAGDTVEQLRRQTPYSHHSGDTVMVDAIVLDSAGGMVAQIGLPSVSGGMASHLKTELYGAWLTQDPARRMSQIVAGTGMTAQQGLYKSNNKVAIAVGRQLGIENLMDHLRSQGYHVIGPFDSIVLGAGVTGSPWLVAGNFAKFGYAHPGYRVTASMLSKVSDADTGAVLFEPAKEQTFSAQVAESVRSAMEQVSLQGTARRPLRTLAQVDSIAAKTGTAGFYRRGRWQGEGGSWCAAIDHATGLTVVVRMRWSSGRPFELEGGQSAAYVVAKFLTTSRVQVKGATN